MSLESMSPLEGGSGVTGALAAAMIEGLLPGVVQVQSSRGRGAGAGFVWSSDGSVMTNHHVVAGSGTRRRRIYPRCLSETPTLCAWVSWSSPSGTLGVAVGR